MLVLVERRLRGAGLDDRAIPDESDKPEVPRVKPGVTASNGFDC